MEGAADLDGDGVVTADELSEYVHTQVRDYTKGDQNPTSDKTNFDPSMLIAFNPSGAQAATPMANKFGGFVFESNMDEVEVFVDGVSKGIASKGKPLNAPGLNPDEHSVKGVHQGYGPDGPRQQMGYPRQHVTSTPTSTSAPPKTLHPPNRPT